MKKIQFTEDQMVAILREADNKAVPGVAKSTASVRKATRGEGLWEASARRCIMQ